MAKKTEVYVVGHRNPDTDSICSAIAYAYLKNQTDDERDYIACRAGHMSEETQYALSAFNVDAPAYIKDMRPRVRDIEIRETPGVGKDISLKTAWNLMKEKDVVTLAITDEAHKLEGMITIGDITNSYMEGYDSRILSIARTSYKNIIETLDGELVVCNDKEFFDKGKVLIAAANPDLMENYIETGDLVILGNRYESQLCAIEMKAGCIVVCEGANVSKTIKHLAEENNCTVIQTPHDTYTVARLMNQAMPISYFMKSENLVTFRMDDFLDDIKDTMASKRHRDFPILDKAGNYIGMISRRNLLNMRKKEVILVDHNEKSQTIMGIDEAEILEIIDHHRIGNLETLSPVFFRNQPLGCTATIVYLMFKERNVEIPKDIAGMLVSAILSDTLMFRSPTCTETDKKAAAELSELCGIVPEEYARKMFKAGSNLKDKSAKDIFYQDFKRFSISDISFGVGQINAMSDEELNEVKERVYEFMSEDFKTMGVSMVMFMLTNIIEESTELLFIGKKANDVVASAFNVEVTSSSAILPGVVSRKKQLVPALMSALQG